PEHPRFLESLAHHSLILVSRPRLHALSLRGDARQMVCAQGSRSDRRLFFSLRTDGPVARPRASLHRLRILSAGVALCVAHSFPLEYATPLPARRSALA